MVGSGLTVVSGASTTALRRAFGKKDVTVSVIVCVSLNGSTILMVSVVVTATTVVVGSPIKDEIVSVRVVVVVIVKSSVLTPGCSLLYVSYHIHSTKARLTYKLNTPSCLFRSPSTA
mgnify:CR=1 FL=1